MNDRDYIRRKQVADMLGVSPQQVDTYRKRGLIHSVQYIPNGVRHYLITDVQKLLKQKS